jgi:hypothetical protein
MPEDNGTYLAMKSCSVRIKESISAVVFSWYNEHRSSLCSSHFSFDMRAAFRVVPFLNLSSELSDVVLASISGATEQLSIRGNRKVKHDRGT